MRTTSFHNLIMLLILTFCVGLATTDSFGDTVDFRVDPTTIDSDMDGFISGSEFSPVGSDGTVFSLSPTDNLVGAPRFLLSATQGLHFGGGGGSTLSFDFSVNKDLSLESYTLSSSGFILGNPLFNISDAGGILSSGNTANPSGATHNFISGPIDLVAGTTYTFETTVFGAGTQSFMQSFQYTAIPEPGSCSILAGAGLLMVQRRRRQCKN